MHKYRQVEGKGGLSMREALKVYFFTGVMALVAVLATIGVASAVTEVTSVQPIAAYQTGNTEIVIDASIVCENIGDVVVFEAVQTQGRHIGTGVLEVTCSAVETVNGPFTISVFDGMKFRNGPFSLWVRSLDNAGAFVKGQGFQLKGK
jgi:hypothetical protein